MTKAITPMETYLKDALLWCALIAAISSAFAAYVSDTLFGAGIITRAVFTGVFIFAGITAFIAGRKLHVDVTEMAYGKSFGKPNGKIYAPGDPWLYPWEKGRGIVSNDRTIDPPIFTELAKDNIPVETDLLYVGSVADPWIFDSASQDPFIGLSQQIQSSVATFVRDWKKAEYLNGEKDLLCRFLILPADDTDPAHTDFRQRLVDARVLPDGTELFAEESIDDIMCVAGAFLRQADEWGVHISKVNVRRVGLPQDLLDAALEQAKQKYLMNAYKEKAAARHDMALAIVASDATGLVNIRDAYNLVDRMMDYDVKTSITEFDIRDLHKVVSAITSNPDIAKAIQSAAAALFELLRGRNNS